MDKQWVRHLAESRLENGEWRPSNPASPRDYGRNQIMRTVNELYQDVRDALQVFNDHARREKKLTSFPTYVAETETMNGFVVVVGRLQLHVGQMESLLRVVIARMEGFQRQTELLHELEAHCDPFGGISWIMDRKSIMTKDMLVKQLLHDICHEAFQSEW